MNRVRAMRTGCGQPCCRDRAGGAQRELATLRVVTGTAKVSERYTKTPSLSFTHQWSSLDGGSLAADSLPSRGARFRHRHRLIRGGARAARPQPKRPAASASVMAYRAATEAKPRATGHPGAGRVYADGGGGTPPKRVGPTCGRGETELTGGAEGASHTRCAERRGGRETMTQGG